MSRQLQTLLRVRQNAEKSAIDAVRQAAADRNAAERRQEEMQDLAAQAHAQARTAAVDSPAASQTGTDAGPSGALTAAALADHARFVERLRQRAAVLTQQSEDHRNGPLTVAREAEHRARATHLEARQAREAIEKHLDRQHAQAARTAERRQDDRLGDLASAAHVRRQRDPR